MGTENKGEMMKTICVLFVIAAVACAMPTEKDSRELADSDAVETGNILPNGNYKIKGGKSGNWCRSIGSGNSNEAKCDNGGGVGFRSKWALFNNGGKIVLRSHRNIHKRCEDQGDKWRCNQKTSAGSTEKFEIASLGNNQYSLKGGKNNKYCADEGNRIRCNRDAVQQWEKFTITPL